MVTPPPLLSNHAKHGKFAKQIISADMPKYEKRGGGVKLRFAGDFKYYEEK